MDLILTGILLAIGFYISPFVIAGVFAIIVGILAGIAKLFGSKDD